MANKYLRSGAVGTPDGSSWANAYLTETLANVGLSAGDTLFVSEDHSESSAVAITLTSPGTAAAFNRYICANHTGSVPPVSADLATTAAIATTTTNTINIAGYAYHYGVNFNAGAAASAVNIIVGASAGSLILEKCGLKLNSTNVNSRINFATAAVSPKVLCINCTATFGSTSQAFLPQGGVIEMRGLLMAGSTPTVLIGGGGARSYVLRIADSDLSAITGTIIGAQTTPSLIQVERCKLNAAVTLAATPTVPGAIIDFIDCDSSTGSTNKMRFMYSGTMTTELTVILSTPSVPPNDGSATFSRKIVTNANDNVFAPFESLPMGELYVGATGSAISQTFELMTDNVVLTNADAWIEIEALSTSGSVLGVVATSAPVDPLAAASNLTTSTATWTTTGLGTPKPQKIVMTWTPQVAGTYRAVLKLAKPSITAWLSPPALKAG